MATLDRPENDRPYHVPGYTNFSITKQFAITKQLLELDGIEDIVVVKELFAGLLILHYNYEEQTKRMLKDAMRQSNLGVITAESEYE